MVVRVIVIIVRRVMVIVVLVRRRVIIVFGHTGCFGGLVPAEGGECEAKILHLVNLIF